jgi:hypothetical protein
MQEENLKCLGSEKEAFLGFPRWTTLEVGSSIMSLIFGTKIWWGKPYTNWDFFISLEISQS